MEREKVSEWERKRGQGRKDIRSRMLHREENHRLHHRGPVVKEAGARGAITLGRGAGGGGGGRGRPGRLGLRCSGLCYRSRGGRYQILIHWCRPCWFAFESVCCRSTFERTARSLRRETEDGWKYLKNIQSCNLDWSCWCFSYIRVFIKKNYFC